MNEYLGLARKAESDDVRQAYFGLAIGCNQLAKDIEVMGGDIVSPRRDQTAAASSGAV